MESERPARGRRALLLILLGVCVGVAVAWLTRPSSDASRYPVQDASGGTPVMVPSDPQPGLRAQSPVPTTRDGGLALRVLDARSKRPVTGLRCALLAPGVSPELARQGDAVPGGEETASGVLQLRRPGPDNAGDSHLYVVSAAGYEPGILQVAAADFASARERELHLAPLDRVVRGRVVSNTGQVVPGVAVWASSSDAARHASGHAVANVTRGVYRTVSGEAGRFQLPCSGRYVSLQVREPAWMDISSLHGRVRGQLYELWARTRGVLVGPETDEVELVVAQPRFIAVRLVDQWGDPVQAQARVTLVDGRFVLTDVPIRLAKGWLKPRLYGGRPDGILSAVVAPQDARVTTLVERLVIEVSAHGYERTFAEVPVQEPTGIDQAAKATAQTVVVRSLDASRVRPIELVVHRKAPAGCAPVDACSLVYRSEHGQEHRVAGRLMGEPGAVSRWKFHGVPARITRGWADDGFGRSNEIALKREKSPIQVRMPPPAGVVARVETSGGVRLHLFELALVSSPGWKPIKVFPTGGGKPFETRIRSHGSVHPVRSAQSGAGLGTPLEERIGREQFFPLHPGVEHPLQIRALGCLPAKVRVRVAAGEVRILKVTLEPRTQ